MSKSVRYAAGKIPGSFFRREGRPSTEAILVCRLIDRPLRPTFVDGLRNEVQIVITVLSHRARRVLRRARDQRGIRVDPDLRPAVLRPGRRHPPRAHRSGDQWVAFPKFEQLAEAVFDLTVAGRLVTDKNGNEDVAIMMVEAEATEAQLGPHQGRRHEARRGRRRAGSRGGQAVPRPAGQGAGRARRAVPPRRSQDFPLFPPYSDDDLRRRRRSSPTTSSGRLPDRRQDRAPERRRRAQGPRQGGHRGQGRGGRAARRGERPGQRRLQVGHARRSCAPAS